MAGREDVIKFINEIGSGDADVFIGAKNTPYSDRTSFVNHIGSISKDGISVDPIVNSLSIKSGTPLTTKKEEITEIGLLVKLKLQEMLAVEQWNEALAFGATSSVAKNNTEAITAQEFKLYGNNWMSLDYSNITVTSISDDSATPNSYTGADITTNFLIDTTNARIRMKTAAEGGELTPEYLGATFYLTGTWKKPKEVIWKADTSNTEKDYYSLAIRIHKGNQLHKTFVIYKANPEKPETISYSPGKEWVLGIGFQAVQDPGQSELYEVIDEIA